jgi:hypothetical protein
MKKPSKAATAHSVASTAALRVDIPQRAEFANCGAIGADCLVLYLAHSAA